MGQAIWMETGRLLLRTPRLSDAAPLLAIRNSPYVLRFNPMKPWDLARMEGQVEKESASDKVLYVEEKATGGLIGGIWLGEDALRYGPTAFDLSYYLAENQAGKGYMTEALARALAYAFQDLGAQVVSARVFRENRASARVLEKLGFVHEGTLRFAVQTADGQVHDDMLFSRLP